VSRRAAILLDAPRSPLPLAPTRDQVINVQANFAAYAWTIEGRRLTGDWDARVLSPAGRQAFYAKKHALGLTHIVAQIRRAPGPLGPNAPTSRQALDDFLLEEYAPYLRELIAEGFIPMPFLASDGQSLNGQNFSTYGWRWGMDTVPYIIDRLRDLAPYALWVPGFEVIGPGGDWTPTEVNQFLVMLGAAVHPLGGQVGFEMGSGYAWWGDGAFSRSRDPREIARRDGEAIRDADAVLSAAGPLDDWNGPAGMAVDCFLQEFVQPVRSNPDGAEQDSARALGPAKRHIQPKNDGPWYHGTPTPRGPRAVCAFEFAAWLYNATDPQMDANVTADRDYLRSLGWSSFGN